jgi:hypothetical protein
VYLWRCDGVQVSNVDEIAAKIEESCKGGRNRVFSFGELLFPCSSRQQNRFHLSFFSSKLLGLFLQSSDLSRVGVGDNVDASLVRRMASAGRGQAEFVTAGEPMETKGGEITSCRSCSVRPLIISFSFPVAAVMRQLRRALSPALSGFTVRVSGDGWLVSPQQPQTVFGGDVMSVFALRETPDASDTVRLAVAAAQMMFSLLSRVVVRPL